MSVRAKRLFCWLGVHDWRRVLRWRWFPTTRFILRDRYYAIGMGGGWWKAGAVCRSCGKRVH